MASPRPPAPDVEAHKSFEEDCENLRLLDKMIDYLKCEIGRLMKARVKARVMWFSNEFGYSSLFTQYQRNGFGDQAPHGSQWWKWPTRPNLFDFVENPNRELETANVSKTNLEKLRDSLRRRVNTVPRPFRKSLGILDLPDETLLRMFELMEDAAINKVRRYPWDNPEHYAQKLYREDFDGKDIINTHLACQRLRHVSSGLVLRFVRVSCNEASLARLEKISQNSDIAEGVRVVRVDLRFSIHYIRFAPSRRSGETSRPI